MGCCFSTPLSRAFDHPTADPAAALEHGTHHAVIPQLLRPLLAAYLAPSDIRMRGARAARCCVSELRLLYHPFPPDQILLSVEELPYLTSLHVANSSVGANFFRALVRPPSALPRRLRVLNLHGCKNVGLEAMGDIRHLTSLETLALGDCPRFNGQCITLLPSLASLSTLYLSSSEYVNASTAAFIAKLKSLKTLSLSNCRGVDASCLAALAGAQSLEVLYLACCLSVEDTAVAQVARLKNLRVLDVSHCRAVGTAALYHLSTLEALETLELGYCDVTSDGLAFLRALPNLSTMSLHWCTAVDTNALTNVAQFPSLTALDLSSCPNVDAAGMAQVETMNQLTTLNLSHCDNVGTAGLAHAASMRSLHTLYLTGWASSAVKTVRSVPNVVREQYSSGRGTEFGVGLAYVLDSTPIVVPDIVLQ